MIAYSYSIRGPIREGMTVTLNPKQLRFVVEYPKDCNGTQAAIRAGYSPKTANEQAAQLLAKLSIREAIDEALKARAERTKIDSDWVVTNFRNLYLEALAAKDYAAAARCLENLGKHVGVFREHNRQKREYSPEDVAAIRAKLEAAGMNFRCVNAPPELTYHTSRVNRIPHQDGTGEGEKLLVGRLIHLKQ